MCGLQLCQTVPPGGVQGGVISPLLDLGMLIGLMFLFFAPSLMLHQRSRRLGY